MTNKLTNEQVNDIVQRIVNKMKWVDISSVKKDDLYYAFKDVIKDQSEIVIDSNNIDMIFYSQFMTSLVYQGCASTTQIGTYDLSNCAKPYVEPKKSTKKAKVETTNIKCKLPSFVSPITESHLIPEIDPRYVKFGNYNVIESVINAGRFSPIWITGLSGNGKTYSVEQACAELKREMILINITNETNEEDLIGSFSLETVNSFEIECDESLYLEFLETIGE